jgi:hypothetical protein
MQFLRITELLAFPVRTFDLPSYPNIQKSGRKSILSVFGLRACVSSLLELMITFLSNFEDVESQEDFVEKTCDIGFQGLSHWFSKGIRHVAHWFHKAEGS